MEHEVRALPTWRRVLSIGFSVVVFGLIAYWIAYIVILMFFYREG